MSTIDWLILVATLFIIVAYGVYKTRHVKDMEGFFRGSDDSNWATIGLSVMATQASAITFLSMPGQAYDDGMSFVQFYFGLPLAMVVISAVLVPIYYRLKVYTAYEYLEHRFDARVRYLGAIIFLVQRGLATGITIFAPSIILSTLLGWPLQLMNIGIGALVIIYTVSGGTQAVTQTQKQQMTLMLAGMLAAAGIIIARLPDDVTLGSAVRLAGALGRMNVVSLELDWHSRYNVWSGLTGGFFLALSYFGTDQSQVQRYLSGRSVTHSRLGLLFNGALKIPMQFVILFIGVLVFVFHIFVAPPAFFNTTALARAQGDAAVQALEVEHTRAFTAQRDAAYAFVRQDSTESRHQLHEAAARVARVRNGMRHEIARVVAGSEAKDGDYIFLAFVLRYVPHGLVGLLIAVIFCAAMSSTASELTALGSTTTVDLYKRIMARNTSPEHDFRMSKLFTVLWGVIGIGFACTASLFDNLIEAINILGSVFYGTVLGMFVVGFFIRRITATPVFIAALIAQVTVIVMFFTTSLGFLWYNALGCAIVVALAALLELVRKNFVNSPPGGTTNASLDA